MTATALKMETTPMAPYMGLMRTMNREQKLIVMAFLVSIMQEDEESEEEKKKTADEEFVKELLALRYDGEMSADEKKRMLRESHYFGDRNIKSLYYER
jgi:hypothetical protein